MNRVVAILVLVLFFGTGCRKEANQDDNFITIDVTKSYSQKELILQDFMDVEYIPLEMNDDFLCQGFVQAVGKDIILMRNFIRDGNLFIFDRKTGKGLKKINRRGQGGEEYTNIDAIILDEDNGEIFVNDIGARRILVYDLDGNYKRSFKHKEGAMYDRIYNFDRENLICYDGFVGNDGMAPKQSFMIISKQDGIITHEIDISYEEKILTALIVQKGDMTWGANPSNHYPIVPYMNNFVLIDSSSDTIYSYSQNHTMEPFIVRTPPVGTMEPEVFLFPNILTDRYYFMRTVKKEYDFETNSGFPSTDLVYDKYEKRIFRCTIYNDDFTNKEQAILPWMPMNNEIATWHLLQAPQLIESYERGILKGRLKEVAAGLDEEDNPVIMLIKHKK